MTALDTMKSALQCSKTEAASLRIRVRQLEKALTEAATASELEADKLRQGSEFLVAENARLVTGNSRLKEELSEANDILRSVFQIGSRRGFETNWPAFQARVDEALKRQHVFMYPKEHVDGTCKSGCDVDAPRGAK